MKAVLLSGERDIPPSVTDVVLPEDPERTVLIKVSYSSLNYKDAMVVRGLGKMVRTYPHVPGIDLAGEVISDASGKFQKGERVVVNGFRMGELTWGGWSEYARAKPDWVTVVPSTLSLKDAMAIGTAGLSAALALQRLEDFGISPSDGPMLVTGATGGVGSVATALAASRGYEVTASTGKASEHDYLTRLGARQIIAREDLSSGPSKPLESALYSSAIDAVGGQTLSSIVSRLNYGGAAASVGLTAGSDFCASIIPLLLRRVSILGIDSVYVPQPDRERAWQMLASNLDIGLLAVRECSLDEVLDFVDPILAGAITGRIVVCIANG
jgi:putative YhdH/YhfP family quinone oxidoreductase